MTNVFLKFLLHQIIARPHKMPEDDFQELRGRILFAIGETEIRMSNLERGEVRDEMGDLRLRTLWREIVQSLRRFSKRDELAASCQEYVEVFDVAGLGLDDFMALTESYLEEIKDIANRSGFEIGESRA